MKSHNRYNRLLAIGDIHGHLEALKELLDKVQPTADDKVVFLGDYVDRGPNSQGVLDELLWFHERFPQTVFIRGNHEQMFMDALTWEDITRLRARKGVPESMWQHDYKELEERADYFFMKPIELERSWWMQGGQATSASFDDSLTNVRAAHLTLLNQTKLYHEEWFAPDEEKPWEGEGFLFVHAGVDVEQPPQHQHPLDLMNRRGFPEPAHNALWTVVHGHTINPDGPELMPKRINLDTGYHFGGKLTCCDVLTRQIWQVERNDG
jgi:serine/threonine protein phosphatase 1